MTGWDILANSDLIVADNKSKKFLAWSNGESYFTVVTPPLESSFISMLYIKEKPSTTEVRIAINKYLGYEPFKKKKIDE